MGDRDEISTLVDFYSRHSQSGAGMNYFYLPYTSQKGSGIGSFLAGLTRGLIPLLRKGGAFLAPYLAKTAAGVMSDYAANPSNTTLKTALKTHGIDSLENITNDALSTMRGGRLGMVGRRKTVTTTVEKKPVRKTTIKRKTKAKTSSVKRKRSVKTSRKTKSLTNEYPFFR